MTDGLEKRPRDTVEHENTHSGDCWELMIQAAAALAKVRKITETDPEANDAVWSYITSKGDDEIQGLKASVAYTAAVLGTELTENAQLRDALAKARVALEGYEKHRRSIGRPCHVCGGIDVHGMSCDIGAALEAMA